MGKALYRKYRSRSLDEIVGQDHITSTLRNALKQGKLSHAYLLTGPKGVGKTSVARILAHEVNGLPYSEDPHLDIIEIDAASNRRIDEIRELREHMYSAPNSAKYKVFIIDEVHMLTKEAFNALLKSLEEPPEHVIFILATTETHKLPETIISRTQRFSFRPVPKQEVVDHLKTLVKKEKLKVSDDALDLIAEHGEGSFRDSISLLEQAASSGEDVTVEHVRQLLGRAPEEQLNSLFGALEEANGQKVLTVLNGLYEQGFEPITLGNQIATLLRNSIVSGKTLAGLDQRRTLELLHTLLGLPSAHNPKHTLEVILLKAVVPQSAPRTQNPSPQPIEKTPEPEHASQPKPEKTKPSEPVEDAKPTPKTVKETVEKQEEPTQKAEIISADSLADVQELWNTVLDNIKKTHNTLYGIARMAKPRLEGDDLYLELKFAFHHKQLNTSKNTGLLQAATTEARGKDTKLHFKLSDNTDSADTPSSDVSTISNIFGGAELL